MGRSKKGATLDTSFATLFNHAATGHKASEASAVINFNAIHGMDGDTPEARVAKYRKDRREETVAYLKSQKGRKYAKVDFSRAGKAILLALRDKGDSLATVALYLVNQVTNQSATYQRALLAGLDISDVLAGKEGAYGRLTTLVAKGSKPPKKSPPKVSDKEAPSFSDSILRRVFRGWCDRWRDCQDFGQGDQCRTGYRNVQVIQD